EVYVMNADGSGQTRVFADPDYFDGGASWSPDGGRLAFHRAIPSGDFNSDIYAINLDGTGLVQLTTSPGQDNNPNFSPDGSRIVFESGRDGNYEIYVMNADG